MFEVMMMIVFLKLTTRPLLSVNRPSSNTCNRILNTSGCAFSISSNNTTEYGLRRMASVNCPPSSYPTYPGGAPTKRETLCFSWYSLMSIRVIIVSSSNRNSASALANSVLPTPVVPRKINDPIGRFGSCTTTAYCIGYGSNCFVLADNPLMKFFLKMEQFVFLTL